MVMIKIAVLFIVFTFAHDIYAAEPPEANITIDFPPEVIGEDFVRVAFAQPDWFIKLQHWMAWGDIDIGSLNDVQGITEEKFSLLLENKSSKFKHELVEIFRLVKKLKSYKEGSRIAKWEGEYIYINPVDDFIVSDQIKTVIKKLNYVPNLHIIMDEITSNNKSEGIKINIYEEEDRWSLKGDLLPRVMPIATPYYKDMRNYHLGWDISDLKLDLVYKLENTNNQGEPGQISFTFYPENSPYLKTQYSVEGFIYHNSHKIFNSVCFIYRSHPEIIKRHLTTECILRSLGLPNYSENNDSILAAQNMNLNIVRWDRELTDYDLLLVKLLYNSNIKAGMNYEEAYKSALDNYQRK